MKNFFKEYCDYMNDNPKRLWFKRKLYGWGWTPATWEGWFVTLAFVAVVAADFFRIDTVSHSGSDTLINFVPHTAIFVILLIVICIKKGEKPRWQWGNPKNKNHD